MAYCSGSSSLVINFFFPSLLISSSPPPNSTIKTHNHHLLILIFPETDVTNLHLKIGQHIYKYIYLKKNEIYKRIKLQNYLILHGVWNGDQPSYLVKHWECDREETEVVSRMRVGIWWWPEKKREPIWLPFL